MSDPLVVAEHEGSAYVWKCVRCKTRLALTRVDYLETVECQKCGAPQRVATRSQVATVQRQARRHGKAADTEARRLEKEVEELAALGFVPPDQVTVLGRSASGKSVYLSALYHQLWTNEDDLTGRTLDGRDHAYLLGCFEQLKRGDWIASTTNVRPCDLLLQYKGTRMTLKTMDYPGEVFRQVFFENRLDSREQQQLFSQVQSTMAAMLLIDPEAAVRHDEEHFDLEFSCLQVVEHLRARGLEDNLMVMLTKRDQNHALVEDRGGPRKFVASALPRLHAIAPRMLVAHLSSVQTAVDSDGRRRPAVDVENLDHVRIPLRKLLDRIDPAHLKLLEHLDREAVAATRGELQAFLVDPPIPGEEPEIEIE